MSGWGQSKEEHWSATQFDNYGFRRSDLKAIADKLGVNLDIPIEEIVTSGENRKPEIFSEEDISVLRSEISLLKDKIKKLKSERPTLLGEYRKDDPLLLAIQIRNTEWNTYDPDNDRATRGNQVAIIQDLEGKGFSNSQAKAIEMVACPIKRG
ncbi:MULTISPECIES: hypothetical protein [Klebsiella pneumoniae complex]|uniref:hypothetical protein n=1 Tax=Klebsiella pneumoniae complex TaxID=3390273 RepID=UPI00164C7193|nr:MULTISPECIES: hypothetical protein [Klebsiella]MBC5075705.1 hypothetical protein [Klebsiella quasipneumoniae]MBC5182403.1 hypothetical protein [Klebsiella quasipneumoniae]MCE0158149.1 hypothetical protein [Klebsiella variicola subsp. variicola]